MPYDPIERWEWEGGAVAEGATAAPPAKRCGRPDEPLREIDLAVATGIDDHRAEEPLLE